MSLTRITSDLIKDGTVGVADLASATKTAISGSSASGSVSTRTTALETASGSFSTRITNATASINSISSSQATRTANLVIASSSLSSSVATLKGSGTLQSVATNASPTFAGATITGTLTAQEVHTEFTSASIIFSSGSTIFGDTTDDTHLFSGSVSIHNGEVGVAAGGSADELVIKNNGDAGISVLSPNGNSARIQFGSTSDNDIGHIGGFYNSGNEYLFFSVDGSTRMVIGGATNAGNVGIGTTNPDAKLKVEESTNGANVEIKMRALTDGGGGRTFSFTADPDARTLAMGESGELVIKEGKVGISTNAPAVTTHIHGDDETLLYITTDAANRDTAIYFGLDYDGTGNYAGIQFDQSDDALKLFNANSLTNHLVINNSGNIGIGTATPTQAELTVIGQISGSNTIKAGRIADGGKAFMADVIDGGQFDVLEVTENGAARWSLVFEGNAAENALTLNSNAQSNVANIEPDGSIYLGVQQSTLQKNSSHRLNVQAPHSTGAWISTFANNSYPTFQLYRTNNTTIGSYTATANNDIIGAINWYGSSASAHTLGASIDVRQDGSANTNTPTRMDFYVSPGGNISNALMSLDGPTQRVGINTKTPDGTLDVVNSSTAQMRVKCSSAGDGILDLVAGGANDTQLRFYEDSTFKWRMRQNAGGSDRIEIINGSDVGVKLEQGSQSWAAQSDERIKENLVEITNATQNLNQLRCVNFNFKFDKEREHLGLIAQEVQKFYPQIVSGDSSKEIEEIVDEDGIVERKNVMNIEYTSLIPVLVKSIQELTKRIEELEK